MESKRLALAQALLGKGMAKQAGNDMQLRQAYNQYAIRSQTTGQQPLPYDQWKQKK